MSVLRIFAALVFVGLGLGRSLGQEPDGSLAQRVKEFPSLGITVTERKWMDPATGAIYGSTVDQSGHAVDFSKLRAQESALRRQDPRAKWCPSLRERFRSSTALARLPVVLWLSFDQTAIDEVNAAELSHLGPNPNQAALTEAEKRASEIIMGMNESVVEDVRHWLEATGLPVRYWSTTAPVVFTNLTRTEALGIGSLSAVDTLYLDESRASFSNWGANSSHRTTRVHDSGVKGRGIRVATIDGRAESWPLWLEVAESFQPNLAATDHGTAVAGCIASRHPSRLGASPDVTLYCANPSGLYYADITAAGDWLVLKNIDVTSMSFSSDQMFSNAPGYLDRYFDYHSRNFLDSYLAASGNGALAGNQVNSPGKGWNVVAVGAFDDNGTPDYADDAMVVASSYLRPVGGANKPNVSAMGSDIDTLGLAATGFLQDATGGTSMATAHAAGNLCNAMVVNTTIKSAPEAAMALMMATAWNNLEGASPYSDQDGAGGINGLAAFRTARDSRVRRFLLTHSSFSTGGYFTSNITLLQGQRARVCIAWSTSTASSYTSSALDADLDLVVYEGANVISGFPLAQSASYDDNYEIVEFTAPSTGSYTLRINDFRFDGASERIGVAWTTKYKDTAFGKLYEKPDDLNPLGGPTVGNPNFNFHIELPGSWNVPYAVIPSATRPYFGGPNTSVSPLTWYPITWDSITQLWLQDIQNSAIDIWTDSLGALGGGGIQYDYGLAIPNDPNLAGFTLYNIVATFAPGYPDNIKEFSEIKEFTILPQPSLRPLSDNGSFTQALPSGFQFYGQSYTQCGVNMNGNITFGGYSSDATPTSAEMLNGPPRLCFAWADLKPHLSIPYYTPVVRTRQLLTGLPQEQQVVIEFRSIPGFGGPPNGTNGIRITLFGYTNEIKIEYFGMDMDGERCIVGISPGQGLSSAGEIDLSSSGEFTGGTNQALFEEFTGPCPGVFCFGEDNFDFEGHRATPSTLRFIPSNQFTANGYKIELELK